MHETLICKAKVFGSNETNRQYKWHLGLWLAFAHCQVLLYILPSFEVLRRGGSLVGVTAMG